MYRCCLLILIFLFAIPSAHAKRIALVIGNDDYANVTKLQKAVNDATAVAAALGSLKFKVFSKNNADRQAMNQLLGRVSSEIEVGDEVLFYFSGHGVSVDGQNFLLPTDIPPVNASLLHSLKKEAFSEDEIISLIQQRGAKVSILIIDACRNNPFPKEGGRSVGRSVGLGRSSSPAEGTFILYSAGKGQEALDRLSNNDKNPNSVFTRKLLPMLKKPGLSIAQMAKGLRIEVQDLAVTAKAPYQNHKQFPSYYDEVRGDFYFVPGAAQKKTVKQTPKVSADETLWKTIENSKKASDFEFYLSKFPKGNFVAVAELKLKKLRESKVAVVVPRITKDKDAPHTPKTRVVPVAEHVEFLDAVFLEKMGLSKLGLKRSQLDSCKGCVPFILYCRKKVNKVSDLVGVRVVVNRESQNFLRKFKGMKPQLLSNADLFRALEMGTVACKMTGGGMPKYSLKGPLPDSLKNAGLRKSRLP